MANSVTVQSAAKINLTLDILGRRDDGYHEVEMVMQTVGLYDTVRVEAMGSGIELSMNTGDVPADESNLAYKAAKLFLKEHDIKHGVRIYVEKRIPIAAGLAGGSADAAGMLRAMNRLFYTRMTVADFRRLGAELGSDVPYSIEGGTMLAKGRGEILSRLAEAPPLWVVLAKPPVSVSTAWAYREYDAMSDVRHPDTAAMISAIDRGNGAQVASYIYNVLEHVTKKKHPIIGEYENILRANGAMNAIMSGSGPTIFALAQNENDAKRAADALRCSPVAKGAEIFVVPLTGQHEIVKSDSK